MTSVSYLPEGAETAIVVEHDRRKLFWPYRVRGPVRVGDDVVERSWRGPDLREALGKAARSGCLSLAGQTVDAVVGAVALVLERQP